MTADVQPIAVTGIERWRMPSLVIGIIGLVLSIVGFFIDRETFFRSYLPSFLFWFSIVAGSLRHWVSVHHENVDSLRVKVPVSLHHPGDDDANHDSQFSLGLPLGEADPVKRLEMIHERTLARKHARDAERREVLLHELGHVSPRLERFATQLERRLDS